MSFRTCLLLLACPGAIAMGVASCSDDVAGNGPLDGGADASSPDGAGPDATLSDAGADGADSGPVDPCPSGPAGQIGATAAAWTFACNGCTTTVTDATDAGVDLGDAAVDAAVPPLTCASAVRFESNAATSPLVMHTPATGALNLDVRALTTLRMYLRANNPNTSRSPNAWQGLYPTVVLRSGSGAELRYEPTYHYLPYAWQEGWQRADVTLAGGRGWTRTLVAAPDGGADAGTSGVTAADVLADVDAIEIAADTWQYDPFTIDVAGMTFLTVAPPACDDIVADFSTTNPNPPWRYGTMPLAAATFTPFPAVLASALQGVVGFGPASGTFPHVLRNAGRVPASLSEGKLAIGSLVFHPGAAGERSVVRWTAPRAGAYDVKMSFGALTELTSAANVVTTDVHVVHNTTAIFDGALNLGDAGGAASFTGTRTVNEGDTIDVIVGYGDGSDAHDFTVVRGTICAR